MLARRVNAIFVRCQSQQLMGRFGHWGLAASGVLCYFSVLEFQTLRVTIATESTDISYVPNVNIS